MKSLSISTATAAVAISLASSASANEARPYVMPELDTMLFAESPVAGEAVEMPVSASETTAPMTIGPVTEEQVAPISVPETSAPLTVEAIAPQALVNAAFALNAPEGLLSLPPQDGLVTTRSLGFNDVNANYGDIDAFWGDIIAFYGDIDAFWGNINPFYGDIDAFWGDISPFYGDINAFWGDIDAFWGDIDAFSQTNLASIGQFWQTNGALISKINNVWESTSDSLGVAYGLQNLTNNAIGSFGSAGFTQAKATEIMQRHGIDIGDLTTIQQMNAGQRAAFFLDWHDTVNTYAGIDHVDHWMGTVNWTPAVTQIQSEDMTTVVGIIDSSFDVGNVVFNAGSDNNLGGHGAGVASLIVGAHDGEGVMGIAPNSQVTAFNPFDGSGTATWNDVGNGILAIKLSSVLDQILGNDRRASVINLSLGESGYVAAQGLSDMLQRWDIARFNGSTTYVVAAGNDGIAQSTDIEWGFNTTVYSLLDPSMDPALALAMGYPVYTSTESDTAAIFVGSVRADGTISDFSNTPGTACLLDNGVCRAGNELKNFFIVAPGELLLVNDGSGGLARRSGTSFAAPLVSGAIALLHDRWPWLANNPQETTEIIFKSARDLGAPGVDEVYGQGLLDVTASQSPLDFNQLSFTLYQKKGKSYRSYTITATNLLSDGGVPSWWETDDVYFSAFEDIGDTFRDFAIPMSSFTYGKRTNSLGNGYQRLQDFVSDRFANWLLSGGADKDGDGTLGVSQVRSNVAETSAQWSMRFDAIAPQFSDDGAMRNVHSAATLSNPQGNMSFTLGHGQGALALAGNNFGIISDHDHETGGVNPVLGFASGETFAGAAYKPAAATTVSVGYSQNREDWRDLNGVSEIERNIQRQLGAREAEALTIGVEQEITKTLSVNAQYTYLREDDAVLGAQTGSAALLGEGSRTNAVTVSASMDLGNGFSFDLSATGGATQTAEGQLLATSNDVMSTAGQFTVNKRGVMGSRDVLRVSVGQPLTIERGELELRSEQVVDRLTGERGVVTQTIGIDTKRRYTGEIVYATPVTKTSELGVVGRYISAGEIGQDESFMIGANFGLRF